MREQTPATQNECHDWSCSYETSFTMRRAAGITLTPHQILRLPRKMNVMIDRAHRWNVIYNALEQQASPSHLTKYCHAKRVSWLIVLTYETSFTMRRATGITLTPHQIARLPRKMHVMIDRAHIWNVIYNAQSNRHHPHTSPNTAMQNARWLSWLIVLTYVTSFTIGGATGTTLTPHQIVRLPRKMSVMSDRAHRWSVIYNARSNRHHPATSPNTALHLPREIALPNLREFCRKRLKCHF